MPIRPRQMIASISALVGELMSEICTTFERDGERLRQQICQDLLCDMLLGAAEIVFRSLSWCGYHLAVHAYGLVPSVFKILA